MKQYCICCKEKYETPVGFYTKNGFICMRHEGEEMTIFTVSYPGMCDIIFQYQYEADIFIEEDCKEEEERKIEDYKITVGKMNVVEFNNLDEWEG